MREDLDYAEMLEIPVETMTVRRKEKRKKGREYDLQEQLVDSINDRMEEDPAYAESRTITRELPQKKKGAAHFVLIGEFVAACLLVATIFVTNILVTDSAINTFVRGLFNGSEAAVADTRTYSDFTLSPVVNDYVEAEVAVSQTGVMSFTAKCSVYPPCEGTVSAVNGSKESGYTVEIKHSDTFSSILSGLDTVYVVSGEKVKANLPMGYTDGEGEVRVSLYSEGSLLNCYTVDGENGISWS